MKQLIKWQLVQDILYITPFKLVQIDVRTLGSEIFQALLPLQKHSHA